MEDETQTHPAARPRIRGRKRRVLLALVVAGAALALTGRWLEDRRQLRAAHPVVAGRIEVPGLEGDLEIVRDRNGVPHVRAASERDAWLGLGFVHAQDRLGQLLWLRHVARGRTASQVGPSGLAADRWARTLDLAGLAERDLERSSPDARRALDGYAAGVNAWLAMLRDGRAEAPIGLTHEPEGIEDWAPADSLVLAKLRAWQLADVADEMLALEEVVRRLGPRVSRVFFPAYGSRRDALHRADAGGTVGTAGGGLARVRATAMAGSPPDPGAEPARTRPAAVAPLRAASRMAGAHVGSSAWVVSGRLTRRGLPLLAADLHAAPTVPAAFYEAHLRAGVFEVAGATWPGIPAFPVGFNANAAWAATHAPGLVMDLVEETLYSEDPSRHLDGRRWRSLVVREELIEVRGGEDELLEVRSTRSGPLVDGLLGADRPLSVHWSGQRVGGIAAFVELVRASDAEAVERALRRHGEPLIAVAWTAGNAGGVKVAGAVPVREIPSGFQPVPAGNPAYAWAGLLPADDLPARLLGPGRPWAIATDTRALGFDGPEIPIEPMLRSGPRGRRVEQLLQLAADDGPLDLAVLVEMQRDQRSGSADALLASALRLAGELGHEEAQVAALLARWNHDAGASSRGAAAHQVFLTRLARALLEPALGESLVERMLTLPRFRPELWVEDILRVAEAGGAPDLPWTAPEQVTASIRASLRQTWLSLSVDLGSNRDKWSWGRLHPIRFAPLWPGAWDDPAGLGPFPYGGDGSTIAVAEFPLAPSARGVGAWQADVVSAYRFALDGGNLDQALTSLAPGQSGHPAHGHARDGLEGWLRGQPSLLSTSDPVIEDGPVTRLLLVPADDAAAGTR